MIFKTIINKLKKIAKVIKDKISSLLNYIALKIKNFLIKIGNKFLPLIEKIKQKGRKEKYSDKNPEKDKEKEKSSDKNTEDIDKDKEKSSDRNTGNIDKDKGKSSDRNTGNIEKETFQTDDSSSAIKEEQIKASCKNKNDKRKNVFILKILRVIQHITDIVLELIFAFAVIIFIKPSILEFRWSDIHFIQFINFMHLKFIMVNMTELNKAENISYNYVLLFNYILLFYILCKLIQIFTVKGRTKILLLLYIMITVVSTRLIKDNFLIFLILYILIFLCWQFSYGYKTKTIRTKLIICLCLFTAEYIIMLAVLVPDVLPVLRALAELARLPVTLF